MTSRSRTILATAGLFSVLALAAGCDDRGNLRSSSTMGPPTRGGAAAPAPTSATGQNAVTNPSMTMPGHNRPFYQGSDPNFPRNETGVSGKPSATGP